MELEALFHQLLGLEDSWEVTGLTVRDEDGTVEIVVRETSALWSTQQCPSDGAALSAYDHGESRRWRHLNIFEYRCEIGCRLPRGKCSSVWEGNDGEGSVGGVGQRLHTGF